jgi:hypothetical protein
MSEESPSPPAVSCNHLQHAKARDEALGKSTADVLLTKPPTRASGNFYFCAFCRKKGEPTSGLEPLTCSLRVRFGPLYLSRKVAYLRENAFVAYRHITSDCAQVSVPVSVSW